MIASGHWFRRNSAALLIITSIALVYIVVLAFVLQPLNGFWAGDQGVKLIQIQNLIIQRFHTNALIYPGERFDPQSLASPLRGQYYTRDGQTYAMFSDAFAVASAIPFFLFGFPGLYVLPVVATVATLLLINALVGHYIPGAWQILALLVSGLATPIGLYALLFWEHAPTAALVTAAVCLTISVMRGAGSWRIALAGVLLGMAGWLRIEALIGLPALALALLADRRRLLGSWSWLGIGALVGVLPLFAYNQLAFHSFLGPHVLAHLSESTPTQTFDLAAIRNYIAERSAWAHANIVPLDRPLIMVLVATAVLAVLFQRIIGVVWARWVLLIATALLCLTVDTYRSQYPSTSLIMTMPLVLFMLLPGAEQPGEQRQQIQFLSIFAGVFILFCLLAPLPDGGAQWGPRMILPVLPIFVMLGVFKIQGLLQSRSMGMQQIAVIVVVTLAISSGALSMIAGVLRAQDSNRNVVTISDSVVRSHQQVIVTDDIWVPSLLAQLFYDGRLIYWVDQPQHADALLASLEHHGVEQFYFLSTATQRLSDASPRWSTLKPVGDPHRLPYRLIGQTYSIAP